MSQVISQVEANTEKPIDREKVCPLLLRIFYNNNRHNQLNDFSRGSVPPNELQVYTWMDCTFYELMTLIKDVNPDTRRRGTEFSFAIVSPDKHSSRYNMKKIGITVNGLRGFDDSKTLSQCKFEVGDFIDVAINVASQSLGNGGNGLGRGIGTINTFNNRRISTGGNRNFNRFRD